MRLPSGVPSGAGSQKAPEQQHCETGSLCNQDSQINAPQTVNNFAPPKRKLAGKEHHDFVAALRLSCPFKVAVRPLTGSAETTEYAESIRQALVDAGCTPHDPVRMIDVANSYGVSIVFHDNEHIPLSAQALAIACKAARITWTPHTGEFVEPDEVYLMVGLDNSKPQ